MCCSLMEQAEEGVAVKILERLDINQKEIIEDVSKYLNNQPKWFGFDDPKG